jgi:hypothetical protein
MIRARSPLFFAQKEEEGKALQTWTVKDVHPDGKTLTLTSMEQGCGFWFRNVL